MSTELVFEKLTQTLSPGMPWKVGIGGSFFRISASAAPVTVALYKQGRVLGTMRSMSAGDYSEGLEFDAVELINGATGQDVTMQISAGGAGSDSVVGVIQVSGTVNTLEQGYTYTNSYKSNVNLAANTPDIIVAPGANLNGINIVSASIAVFGAGNLRFSLLAKAGAPANVVDGDVIMSGVTINSGGNMTSGFPHSIFIPAGKGLYRISDIAETNVMAHVLYNLA